MLRGETGNQRNIHEFVENTSCQVTRQGRSQVIADARAQHGHATFVRNSAQSAEAFRRCGTCSVSVCSERMRLELCDIYSDTASFDFKTV